MIENGAKWNFKELLEEQRLVDLDKALQRVNRKNSCSNPEKLEALIRDDFRAGFHSEEDFK